MGNELEPVSGTIIVIDADAATEEELAATRRSGPRFPRPHLQRLDTERPAARRIALGSTPPPVGEEIDFDEAVTEVNPRRPSTIERTRPETAS